MRSFMVRILLVAAVAAAPVLLSGCGSEASSTADSGSAGAGVATGTSTQETPIPFTNPDPAQTVPEEQPSPYGVGSTGTQMVGTPIDGLQLRDIRWSDHGIYFRIVFEMGTPDGQQVLQIPPANATLSKDGKELKVVLNGIRSIGPSSSVTSDSLAVGDPVVTAIKRSKDVNDRDDQAQVYIIELAAPATYSLAGLGSPGRIVIDINKP